LDRHQNHLILNVTRSGISLASSNIPIPKPSALPPFQTYGNQLFQNSIIFENVLNVPHDEDDEESLISFFESNQ